MSVWLNDWLDMSTSDWTNGMFEVELTVRTGTYKPTLKLASPWFPWQKAYKIFPLTFGLLKKKSFVNLWFLNILLIKIVFINEHTFYGFWNRNIIRSSEKLMLGYKQTPKWSHDFQQLFQFLKSTSCIGEV